MLRFDPVGGSWALPFKAPVPAEVTTVFSDKEVCSSQTQKGKLLAQAREAWSDWRIQVVRFIWTQTDVSITNFRIPLFPTNALSHEKLSETVNSNVIVIQQAAQLNFCLILSDYQSRVYKK